MEDDFSTTDDLTTDDLTTDDLTSVSADLDGDGFAETTYIDSTGDGVADIQSTIDPNTGASAVYADTTGDGLVDTVVADLDGDGVGDLTVVDTNYDGTPEYVEFGQDPFDSGAEPVDPEPEPEPEPDPFVVDPVEPVDPVVEDPNVWGDSADEIVYHQVQPDPDSDCLPTSVAMILTEMTGSEVPAEEVVAIATEMGVLTENGMLPDDGIALFEHYGVDASVEQGTMDGLRESLREGTDIVIALDADDVYGEGGGPFDEGMVSGHAVVITGIDDNTGMVYINDPGFPDGAGVAIPIETFEDAWEDSGNTMIVAHGSEDVAAADTAAGDTATGGTDEGERSVLEIIMLPLTFVVEKVS